MKSLIFDWSGVVRDTTANQMWLVNSIFRKYGVEEISLEEFKENWEQPPVRFYEKYLPKGYNENERVRLFRELQLSKDCLKAASFSEVVELIRKCKSIGYFLAVVSSDFSETLLPEIKEYGLENIFNEVVTDANDKLEPVKKMITENNLDPTNTFFVGDSNHEIDVAREVGIKSIAVTWGFTSEKQLRTNNPDYIVTTSKELEKILI